MKLLLKTLAVALIVGTALAASTFASLGPDEDQVMKSDLPIIARSMLAVGSAADPFPADYVANIAFVANDENCDEAELSEIVAEVEANDIGAPINTAVAVN